MDERQRIVMELADIGLTAVKDGLVKMAMYDAAAMCNEFRAVVRKNTPKGATGGWEVVGVDLAAPAMSPTPAPARDAAAADEGVRWYASETPGHVLEIRGGQTSRWNGAEWCDSGLTAAVLDFVANKTRNGVRPLTELEARRIIGKGWRGDRWFNHRSDPSQSPYARVMPDGRAFAVRTGKEDNAWRGLTEEFVASGAWSECDSHGTPLAETAATEAQPASPTTGPVFIRLEVTDTEAVALGIPATDDEGHNCDDGGCASVGPHVLARVAITKPQPASERGGEVGENEDDGGIAEQASAWISVFEECSRLGMKLTVGRTGLECVLDFIRKSALATPTPSAPVAFKDTAAAFLAVVEHRLECERSAVDHMSSELSVLYKLAQRLQELTQKKSAPGAGLPEEVRRPRAEWRGGAHVRVTNPDGQVDEIRATGPETAQDIVAWINWPSLTPPPPVPSALPDAGSVRAAAEAVVAQADASTPPDANLSPVVPWVAINLLRAALADTGAGVVSIRPETAEAVKAWRKNQAFGPSDYGNTPTRAVMDAIDADPALTPAAGEEVARG